MKKRTKISFGVLISIIVIVCISIAPTVWRYSLYRKARLTIESGDETKAIQFIIQLHKNPFFNLDWTIQKSVFKVPHGNSLYESIFGCPSCRGDFDSLLEHSARNGREKLTQEMIEMGASTTHLDDEGHNLLIAAIHSNNPAVVDQIIDSGANVNPDKTFYTPIQIAIMSHRSLEIVTLLLHHGADINMKNTSGWTPLDVACIWNTNAIPDLVELGALLGENRKRPLIGQGETVAAKIKDRHNQPWSLRRETPVD